MKKSTIVKYMGMAAIAAMLAGAMTACGESRTPNAKTTLSSPQDLYLSFEREIATTNYVLTWESVENADEYEISVDGETVGKTWKTSFDLTEYVTVDEQATLGVTALGDEEFLDSNESVLQCTAEPVGWEVLYTATDEGYEAYLGLTQLSGRLAIPDTYKGKPVTGIRDFGFACQTASGTAGIARTVEITSVRLPRGLKEIGDNAFWGCDDLREIEFPEGLKKIGVGAFDSCNSLRSITLPASITEWSSAFMNCRDLEEVILPNGLTTIPVEAFWDCISLKEIEIPETVTVIDELAFCGCVSLSSVEIPNGVTVLNGFAECKSLTEITVPSSVVEMNLANCTGLKKAVFEKGSKIEILSFLGCSALEEIELPSSLKVIGRSAFKGCTSLSSVEIPKGVTNVMGGAFGGCTSLKEISVETGNGAYKTVNGDLYTIDGKTLVQYACGKEETEFTVPAGVETVGEWAFLRSVLKKVVVPSWVKRIEADAFYGCKLLEELSLSEGLEYIGENIVGDTDCIKWLQLPVSLKTIGSLNVGRGWPAPIERVYYAGTAEEWEKIERLSSNLWIETLYFYSEEEPTEDGNFWRYVDGVPTPWGEE